ncbi:MAG: pyridoxamine 5'-phosphate oxidase family protein [Chloroflexota bacterium]
MNSFIDQIAPEHRVQSITQLEEQYGAAAPASLSKEIGYISEHYRAFIEKCPFVLVATSGPGGLDCSPRGDPAGFVRVQDEKTVLMPDRRGNNRLDTLRNLMHDPRISLLFLIPGVGETLRINGQAALVSDPALRESFAMKGKVPATVMVITVERIYFQCQKALVRSGIWKPETQIPRTDLPSTGEIIQALSKEPFDGKAYDEAYPERMKQTIY